MKIKELIEIADHVIGAIHQIANSDRDSAEYSEAYGRWDAIKTTCGIFGYRISYSTNYNGPDAPLVLITVHIKSKNTPGFTLNVPEKGNAFVTKE